MIPADGTLLSTTIFLDISIIEWTARSHASWILEKSTDLFAAALDDFGHMAYSEQRHLQETLQECISRWSDKAKSNRAALDELERIGDTVNTVHAYVESSDAPPESFERTELQGQLESAAQAFEQATSHAAIRLKALRTVVVRKAMLGPNAETLYESPAPPAGANQRKPLTKTDRRNYEIILQLANRTFHSPTQYFKEIGRRAVKGRGKPVGHATINVWFKKEGLYQGRGDQDIAALQARAVARAKKELATSEAVSKE